MNAAQNAAATPMRTSARELGAAFSAYKGRARSREPGENERDRTRGRARLEAAATVHAEGAERGWWLGEGHLVQRVHTEHTCRCSKPARLEAGRVASSSPTMACMRCLWAAASSRFVVRLSMQEFGASRSQRWARHGGHVRGAGRGGRRAWLTLLEGTATRTYSRNDTRFSADLVHNQAASATAADRTL
eukprot:scaffold17831_cov70-Phaeocystis_antarctica.AAC.2